MKKIQINGHIGKVEEKVFEGNKKKLTFSVGSKHFTEEKTSYLNVDTFDEAFINKFNRLKLKPGSRIYLYGDLVFSEYTNQNGEKRTWMYVRPIDVEYSYIDSNRDGYTKPNYTPNNNTNNVSGMTTNPSTNSTSSEKVEDFDGSDLPF